MKVSILLQENDEESLAKLRAIVAKHSGNLLGDPDVSPPEVKPKVPTHDQIYTPTVKKRINVLNDYWANLRNLNKKWMN